VAFRRRHQVAAQIGRPDEVNISNHLMGWKVSVRPRTSFQASHAFDSVGV
jgi:hypothetical protein